MRYKHSEIGESQQEQMGHLLHILLKSLAFIVPLPQSIIVMPVAIDGYSSSIVYKLTSLRYIFLYQVRLFSRPKFSRKFIQRAAVLHTVCSPACLSQICAKFVKANAGIFFLVYSACMNFFHLIFPCMNFCFVLLVKYTITAKPITMLELHYPIIQFLTMNNSHSLFCKTAYVYLLLHRVV